MACHTLAKAQEPDGTSQPAQETRAGHAGFGQIRAKLPAQAHRPNLPRETAKRVSVRNHHRSRSRFGVVNVELLMYCWRALELDRRRGSRQRCGRADGRDLRPQPGRESHRSGGAREGPALPGQAGSARPDSQGERKAATAGLAGPGRPARAAGLCPRGPPKLPPVGPQVPPSWPPGGDQSALAEAGHTAAGLPSIGRVR